MAYPQMFDDDDVLLAQVRAICLELPGSTERISFGRPGFFTTKAFAWYGASVKGEPTSRIWDQSVLVRLHPLQRAAMLADFRFFIPAYLGPSGWIGLNLRLGPVNWGEVADLVEESFRMTAPLPLVRQL